MKELNSPVDTAAGETEYFIASCAEASDAAMARTNAETMRIREPYGRG